MPGEEEINGTAVNVPLSKIRQHPVGLLGFIDNAIFQIKSLEMSEAVKVVPLLNSLFLLKITRTGIFGKHFQRY